MSWWTWWTLVPYVLGAVMMFRREVVHQTSKMHKRIVDCIRCRHGCNCSRCQYPESWNKGATWPTTHHAQKDHRTTARGEDIVLSVLIGLLWPLIAVAHLVVDSGKFVGKWFWRMLFPRGVQTIYTNQLTRSAKEREYADMIERSAKLDGDIRRLSEEIGVKSPTIKDQS